MLTVIMALVAGASPTDEAIEALVQGRETTALKILRKAVRDDEDGRIRCLLGEVALEAGRPQEALDVLDALADDAACAGRGAFIEAEAVRALGREDEAATRYGELTQTLLHPTSQPLGDRLEIWADQVLETDRAESWAAELLVLAATLEQDESRRLALARRIAALHPTGRAAQLALEALSDSIAADPESRSDRLLLAPLLDSRAALALLEPLGDDAPTQAVRVAVAPDLATRHVLARQLIARHPTSDEARAARLEVGEQLAAAGWVKEAEDLLGELEEERALWALTQLSVRRRAPDSRKRIQALLERYPTSTYRAEAERHLVDIDLDALRTQSQFDAAAWDALAGTPERALEAAWAAEDTDRRLDELIARWPNTEPARIALRHRALAEGADWLRAHASPAAHAVRAELDQPEIGIRTAGKGTAEVELMVRGPETLELRLHRIDLEGWLRAGGMPDSLGDLDVAVVAPDRTWSVDVPQGSLQTTFTTPVPVDGPGLYAVTAATTDRESRTLLLVSDVHMVARSQGPDLALAAFRDGKPVPRARFLVRSAGTLKEVVADGEGLARATRASSGSAVVVADTPAGPAVVEVGQGFVPETRPIRVAVDLDRPVYQPGDVVRFRAVATSAGDPVRGPWRVSLTSGGTTHQEVRVQADRDGTIEGEVVVPWVSTGRMVDGAGERDFALQALPPEHDSPIPLSTIRVVERVPLGNDVWFDSGEDVLSVQVTDGQGVPVAGLPLRVDDEMLRETDETGSLELQAPPTGLPWEVEVRVPDQRDRFRFVRPSPVSPHQAIRLADPRAAPMEGIEVELEGEGEANLRVVRLDAPAPRPAPLAAPLGFDVPVLKVFERQVARTAPSGLRTTQSEKRVDLSKGSVTLPGLAEGWYQLELVRPDGSSRTVSTVLEVREGARVRLEGAPTVGDISRVRVDGGWALVTAEGGRMLAARLVPPGSSRTLEVDRRWHGVVSLVATTPDDSHVRTVAVDASLQVEVEAAIRSGKWDVSGRVTDAAGNPMRAEVVVRAVDTVLIGEMGVPDTISRALLDSPVSWAAEAARGLGLSHGGWAIPLSPALMAESARAAEARRKNLAAQGRLSESRVSSVLGDRVVLQGAGGLGSRGSGAGGGGYGSGIGGLGKVQTGQAGVAGRQGLALRGARESGLWKVVRTDKNGRWAFEAEAPSSRATWRVDAIAVAPGSIGRAVVSVEPSDAPYLVVDALAPGAVGDTASPRIRVVNPGEDTLSTLQIGDRSVPFELFAGQVLTESVDLAVGESVMLRLGEHSHRLAFPLATPTRIEADRLAATLGLVPDPTVLRDPGRAAVAGRAALAVLPALDPQERARAEQTIRAAVGAVREGITSTRPRYAAQGLLLLAEASEALDLPTEIIEETAALVTVEPSSPQERLELAWARVVAGLDPAEATLGRLVRDRDRLEPEGQALLNRLLVRLDRKALPGSLGTGPQAVLASRASSRPLESDFTGLPPLGAPERPDWLRAALSGLSERPAVEGALLPEAPNHDVWGARRPAGLAGRPLLLPYATPPRNEAVRCGTEAEPCRIGRGEALAVSTSVGSWEPTAGFRWSVDRRVLVATSEGRFTLHGLGRPLHVEVGEAGSPLGQGEVLGLAQQRQAMDQSAADLLAGRPSLEDWDPHLRAAAAQARFAEAVPEDPPGWVAAFEDLRDQVPNTPVALDDVVTTADAYRSIGRPGRAIQVYERAIGQLFLQEAGVISQIEGIVGPLAGIEALRQISARYPAVPLVETATFALPDRLLEMVGNIPPKAAERGVTDTELRLMAAAWDREFVALAPDSPLAPEAGLRLATGLLEMGAERRALAWAERLQRRHPESALTDRWMLLEALVRTELGESQAAQAVLERLSSAELPLGGGRLGPSELRDDARFALGRLAEAERRWDDAVSWYGQVQGAFPEAGLASRALGRVSLSTRDPLVQGPLRDRSTLRVEATNVDEVEVRAYAIDLRTLFLRESGLPRPESVQVDGLRPEIRTTRSIEAGPFPVERAVDLPLDGAGAWLVRLDADSASTVVWVIRSDLELDSVDEQGIRRIVARYAGSPASEVAIRAVGASEIVAAETDIRGVALLGAGSPALAQVASHYALTKDARPQPITTTGSGSGAPRPAAPSLLDRVKSREKKRRMESRERYEYIGQEPAPTMDANTL